MRRISSRRVASAVAAISILAVAVPGVTGTTATAGASQASTADVASRAGLATGPETLWASDADQNADYAGVAASGATWTTIDFDWNSIQSDGRDSWRWNAATDRAVLSARAYGLKIIAVAGYAPAWARVGPTAHRGSCTASRRTPPTTDASWVPRRRAYGAFSTDARLRGSVEVWSLWNEPNHEPFSMPRPDPDKYAAMVKSAYPAVKAVDPTATVLTGGTSPAPDAPDGSDYEPSTWLQMLYQRGAGGFFDGVAHHPYSFPTDPLEAHEWNAFTQTQTIHDVMVAHGDGAKKVWGTEAGAPTGTAVRTVTEAQQAQIVRDYYTGWNTTFRSFTGPLVMFRLRDSSTDLSNLSDNFGLQHRDRSPKPAYAAFQAMMGAGGGGWSPLGGTLASAPASASWAPNRLDVFAADSTGSLIHKWGDGRAWYAGWENLGGPVGGFTGAPAAVAWGPNRLDVFATGIDGISRAQVVGRHAVERLGEPRWFPRLGTDGGVVVRGSSRRVRPRPGRRAGAQVVGRRAWSGWESLGGGVVGDPTAVSWGTGSRRRVRPRDRQPAVPPLLRRAVVRMGVARWGPDRGADGGVVGPGTSRRVRPRRGQRDVAPVVGRRGLARLRRARRRAHRQGVGGVGRVGPGRRLRPRDRQPALATRAVAIRATAIATAVARPARQSSRAGSRCIAWATDRMSSVDENVRPPKPRTQSVWRTSSACVAPAAMSSTADASAPAPPLKVTSA